LLWTLLLLIPVLIVNQEMVVRLGLVTGVGHARLIIERFGKFWGAFSVGDLFVLNFLTIVTEFIGVSLGMQYFGVSPYLSVPGASVALIVFVASGSFRHWERWMYLCVAVSLLTIPLAFFGHPALGPVLHGSVVPGVQGGLDSTALLLIIAIVGTTVAPWQLFFQQSNVIDKRLTPRWMAYERADLSLGALLVIAGAAALMIATAFAFRGTKLAGTFVDAGQVAGGLRAYAGPIAGAVAAIVLINAGIIGASAVTLSSAYAFGDLFKVRHSLHRSFGQAKGFYVTYALSVLAAAAIVLIPNAPLGLLTEAVQALAGVLLPSAIVFLLLLCNDKDVLGPWVNRPWLNAVASAIVGVLVMLSLILAATTFFPSVNAKALTAGLAIILVLGLSAIGLLHLRRRHAAGEIDPVLLADKATWRMPPLAELTRPAWSMTRTVGMYTLRGYLLLAVILLIAKVVALAISGQGAGAG
ncbi:MAG TPA: divalent metal cation transporter, partial [Chloroflexota bacterium]|nr:divalent metal cation transporter [Chloroflexota bacterium]